LSHSLLEILCQKSERDRLDCNIETAEYQTRWYYLKNLAYVQKIGYGIAQARKKLKANNNPDVEFNPNKNENYVSAIVRSSMGVPIS
jgi:hypothetical protein